MLGASYSPQAMAGSHTSVHRALACLRDCRTRNPHLAPCLEFFLAFSGPVFGYLSHTLGTICSQNFLWAAAHKNLETYSL